MQHQGSSSAEVRWSSSIPTTPAACSTKLLREHTHRLTCSNPLGLAIRYSKRSSEPIPTGLPKQSKMDLSRILRTDAAIRGIEKKANSNKHNTLWPKAVLDALDEAVRENRWKTALKIFQLLRKQHWYEPRAKTYTKLLTMLGNCKQSEQASLLFEVMLSEGLKPTIDVYTALVSAYGKSGFLGKAFSVLEEMKSISDCKPDVYAYTVLISCCTKLHRFDLVRRMLAEMSYLGIGCSTVTYNALVDGYGKAKMFKEMENALTDMIENGDSVPDIFTFNSIIGAYGNSGKIVKMEKWYNQFQLMGVQPDLTTFNILIRSYGKASMYEQMILVIEFMEKRFFSPTIITYNIIIEAFGKAGDIEEMDRCFRKMKHRGMKPNSITYCSLVSAYSKAGLLMKVDSVLRQIANSDVVLDTPFFNCVISAYGQAGDLATMRELFVQMKDRKCKPDNITFATMIHTYSAHGITEAVHELENQEN